MGCGYPCGILDVISYLLCMRLKVQFTNALAGKRHLNYSLERVSSKTTNCGMKNSTFNEFGQKCRV